MLIDKTLLDELTEKAKVNPRLRMNYDLRDSSEEESQRMLNAIERGAAVHVPIGQYHTCKSLESGTVIMEFKNTKYDPRGTELLKCDLK